MYTKPPNTSKRPWSPKSARRRSLFNAENVVLGIAGVAVLAGAITLLSAALRPGPAPNKAGSIAGRGGDPSAAWEPSATATPSPKVATWSPSPVPAPSQRPVGSADNPTATTGAQPPPPLRNTPPATSRGPAPPVPAGIPSTASKPHGAPPAAVPTRPSPRGAPPAPRVEEVFEPADSEPTNPQLKLAAKPAQAAVTSYAAIPEPKPGSAAGPVEVARLSAPLEKCCLILRGTQCFPKQLTALRSTNGPQREVIVALASPASAQPRRDCGKFWIEGGAVKFQWLAAPTAEDCDALEALLACVLEARSAGVSQWVALHGRIAMKAVPLKRSVDEVGGTITLGRDDASPESGPSAVRKLKLQLGPGKITRDTGETFEFGKRGAESPLEIDGLAKELEVTSAAVQLDELGDDSGVWKLTIKVNRPEVGVAERKQLEPQKARLMKMQKLLATYRSRRTGVPEKVNAATAVAAEMKIELLPVPSFTPPREGIGDWKRDWNHYLADVENKVPKAVANLNSEVEKLQGRIKQLELDQKIRLQSRLDRLKEASAVLYRVVDDRIRVEDVIVGNL